MPSSNAQRKRRDESKSHGFQDSLFKPTSRWTPPTDLPDLTGEKVIGIDIESKDPELQSRGPGFIRGDAEVAGIALHGASRSLYLPIGHLGGGNMDRQAVINYVRPLVENPDRYICGANLQYELDGLSSLGLRPSCRCIDIQVAEALIDEERADGYELGTLARDYLCEEKDESLLKEAATAYGVDPKSGLWKLPSWYVGPYAEQDAALPIRIFQKQLDKLRKESLESIFELESKLLPLLFKMRFTGVPIDLEGAEALSSKLITEENQKMQEMLKLCGRLVDPWSGPQIQGLCDSLKISYPRTLKGNPSFTGDWLDAHTHPVMRLIADIRELNRMRETFVRGLVRDSVNGRIHTQWKQLASDDGGTRTGRMASANPNLQQIPAGKYRFTGQPNPIGKAIRALFIPPKKMKWAKFDYSQQEPRILTHFAALCDFTGAKLARMAYQDDKNMDFYQYLVDAAGIDRRVAKDMYLGLCYGMGINKLAAKLNRTRQEAEAILQTFNQKVPFVSEIAQSCERSAQSRGYVKTLLGRRRHFDKWEPRDAWVRRKNKEFVPALPRDKAIIAYPNMRLIRCDARKALNALIQGSAADMVKAAIIKIHVELETLPYLAVHDELDFAVSGKSEAEDIHRRVESCVEMTVPIRSDMDYGDHWK